MATLDRPEGVAVANLLDLMTDAILERGLKSSSGEVLILDARSIREAMMHGMSKYVELAKADLILKGLKP